MTKNQKIVLGVGVLALAYYFYTKNKSKKLANQQPSTPSTTPTNPNNGGVVPPINNSGDSPNLPTTPTPTPTPITSTTPLLNFAEGYRLQITENFTAEYFNPSTGNNKIATFTKGQIINAKTVQTKNGGAFATTPEGKYPKEAIGTTFVVLPQNKIQRV
jgi:hypothetical protein